LTNNTIDKFFGFLSKHVNVSKKRLNLKLIESIEIEENMSLDLHSYSGAGKKLPLALEVLKQVVNDALCL